MIYFGGPLNHPQIPGWSHAKASYKQASPHYTPPSFNRYGREKKFKNQRFCGCKLLKTLE